MNAKKIPLRTCVGCGAVRPKREMARVVLAEKKIEVDESGKKTGRGAYLCRVDEEINLVQAGLKRDEDKVVSINPVCREAALQTHAFERAFKKSNLESDLI